jgi:hypothetical protein
MRLGDGGIARIFGAVAGLIVWAVHFGAIYAITAYACARGLQATRVLGLGLIPAGVLGATALALVAAGIVLATTARRLRSAGAAGTGREEHARFLLWFTAGTTLLAMIAILYEGVPTLMVPACA